MVGDEGKGCEEALEMRGKKVGWLGDGGKGVWWLGNEGKGVVGKDEGKGGVFCLEMKGRDKKLCDFCKD